MAQDFQSYKNKIVDFGLKAGSFKNDAGEQIDYKQIVLKANIDGDIEEIVLSGANPVKPALLGTILKGASAVKTDSNFLGDE